MASEHESGRGDSTEPEAARDPEPDAPRETRTVDVLTRNLLRIGLALIGFLLLLFALGRAFGLDLLGVVEEFVATPTGQWLLVAAFALLLILVALRGWRSRRRRA